MANQIIEKKTECELGPVLQPEQPFLYLNEKYAEESGIIIPEVLKIKVKLIGYYLSALIYIIKNV